MYIDIVIEIDRGHAETGNNILREKERDRETNTLTHTHTHAHAHTFRKGREPLCL